MVRFNIHNFELRTLLATFCFVVFVGCASVTAQEISEASSFEISGRVISKTKYGFEVKTKQGDIVEFTVKDSTDFALRMSSPWFDVESRSVAVDGKQTAAGQRTRIKYSLPKGKLYLLAQFRTAGQRTRIMEQAAWRINNYLISDEPIDPVMPTGKELLVAGELDLDNSELIIGENRHPILLGHRGATLRGRSIADIVPQETVVLVTGGKVRGDNVADTVLFMTR